MRCTSYTLRVSIPSPLTVALCSDLHDNEHAQAVAMLASQKPDLIALPGDIGEDPHDTAGRGIDFMRACAAIAPTVYSLGNHDKAFNSHEPMASRIRELGVILLDDSDIFLHGIWIGGLTTGFRARKHEGYFTPAPAPNLSWLDETFCRRQGFKLLLSHHPEYYPAYFRQRDIQLVLSGHAHGGQWQLCGRGILAPGQGLFPKFTYGVHENRLVISRGMGDHTWVPRLFNPREIVMLRLFPISEKESLQKERIDL